MAKRELSSTLRGLKFMQRAAQREEKVKKEEEVNPEGSNTITKKCVVIMEGDPHPGAIVGRMSFQSFNPSIDMHQMCVSRMPLVEELCLVKTDLNLKELTARRSAHINTKVMETLKENSLT
ncbi:Scarecrow-like transcription factor 11, putative isoform 2 [Theobroma cacao]|uniref:Scarecrow-like transcription factor 11, putative isoform 2 n=1 Tax=Theobroma cacao TaxID=3641 RepID=A0A061H015_THECC|nr:Scarecrow-like transcription factor 11, putative isoform 2 [Theobroma cacao]